MSPFPGCRADPELSRIDRQLGQLDRKLGRRCCRLQISHGPGRTTSADGDCGGSRGFQPPEKWPKDNGLEARIGVARRKRKRGTHPPSSKESGAANRAPPCRFDHTDRKPHLLDHETHFLGQIGDLLFALVGHRPYAHPHLAHLGQIRHRLGVMCGLLVILHVGIHLDQV